MKIHLTQTLDCEFEIPKEFENNIQEYINKNIYTPMIAMWDINDMTKDLQLQMLPYVKA